MKPWLRRAAAIAACAGAVTGGVAAYAGAVHNAQGEFSAASGSLDPLKLLPVFLIWFLLAAAVVLAACGAIRFLIRGLTWSARRRFGRHTPA